MVTLDRPERRNALTPDGLADLRRAVDDATGPVLYLYGAGATFCAGADLDVVDGLDESAAIPGSPAGRGFRGVCRGESVVGIAGDYLDS